MSSIKAWRQFDFSGGPQTATSWLLKRSNELNDSRNAMFHEEIGAAIRRPGYVKVGDDFEDGNTPTGFFVARFNSGSRRFVAVNNAGDTQTVIRAQDTSDGSWDDVSTSDFPANAIINFSYYLDYVFISGFTSGGVPLTPMSVDSSLTTSTSLHLTGAPKAGFIKEFNGSLYAANVQVNSVNHPSRAYKSSLPLGVVTYIKGAQTGTLTTLALDDVRYLKVGMAIDIYTAGTETKVKDLTITAVDKVARTISFSSTSVTVADNDEVWLDGRKGKLTFLWNTDYPTPEEADFLELIPGTDSNNTITAVAKSNNRLFLWTKNSSTKWDGSNLVTFSNTVGCIAPNTVRNLEDDWLIWVDAKGNVRARNDASGQQENISRGIRKNYLRNLTTTQIEGMSAVTFDGRYKLYVGMIGSDIIRLVYDFDTNTWGPERLPKAPLFQDTDDDSGELKPYFVSDDGAVYEDESGDSDDGDVIPFLMDLGRDIFGTEFLKKYDSFFLYSENAVGLKIYVSVDNGQYKSLGQITEDVQYVKIVESVKTQDKLVNGTSISVKIAGSVGGKPHKIYGVVSYFSGEETHPHARK